MTTHEECINNSFVAPLINFLPNINTEDPTINLILGISTETMPFFDTNIYIDKDRNIQTTV